MDREDRASLQHREAAFWEWLNMCPDSHEMGWQFDQMHHCEVLEKLLTMERASSSTIPMKESTEEIIKSLMAQISEKEAGKRPVIICEASPFVVQMTDEEMTHFSLFKAKLQSVRPSMDLECWQHWIKGRSAFWRHEGIETSVSAELNIISTRFAGPTTFGKQQAHFLALHAALK